jgi:hypothetical protein
MTYIAESSISVLAIAALLGMLFLLFLGLYLFPALTFRGKLRRLLARLRSLQKASDADLARVFGVDKTLSHLWREYRDTLHEQKKVNSSGIQEVIATRATVPAETFFNAQVLVDSRLRTEFFKHVPGILTGLGIIGTFLGLLQGLQAFRITDDTQVVRASLEALLHGVFHAFLVSAVAIGLAMVITVIEKWVTSGLYRRVEEVAFLLDSLFQSGAGEEYLARLVGASEESASQTRILKDALVADLKAVLSELTDRQIDASAAGNLRLGQQIVSGLQHGLHEPLTRISGAVEQIGGSQSDAIGRVLTDSIAALTQRIQELFGGQIAGINQLQQQTVDALQAAATKLGQMMSEVDSAGQRATDAMASKLAEAMGAMESRQRMMNSQMAEFIGQMRTLVSQSQSETNANLQDAVSRLGAAVTEMVHSLREESERTGQAHIERERRLTENTTQAVSSLGSQVETVVAKVAEVSSELRLTVNTIQAVTTGAVERMNSGAETLYLAANDFAKAGQGISSVLSQSTTVADKLGQASAALSNSTRTLETVVADYKGTREMLAEMLTELGALVASAKKEASLTADVLARIDSATTKLGHAQQQAEVYLEGISEVLRTTHQEFADNMRKTLGDGNRQFYEQLSTATALLREGIEELGTTLADLDVRK